MDINAFGRMIMEMVEIRNSLAKQATEIENNANTDTEKEISKSMRERITGLHDGMSIAIRYFNYTWNYTTFEIWKKINIR